MVALLSVFISQPSVNSNIRGGRGIRAVAFKYKLITVTMSEWVLSAGLLQYIVVENGILLEVHVYVKRYGI